MLKDEDQTTLLLVGAGALVAVGIWMFSRRGGGPTPPPPVPGFSNMIATFS